MLKITFSSFSFQALQDILVQTVIHFALVQLDLIQNAVALKKVILKPRVCSHFVHSGVTLRASFTSLSNSVYHPYIIYFSYFVNYTVLCNEFFSP